MQPRLKLIILFILISYLLFSCEREKEIPVSYDHKLVLVNPDVGDLSSFLYMMEDKVIDLPGTELLVVHYSKVASRYDSTERFIEDNGFPNVRLERIDGDLTEKNLFRQNPCSDAFKEIFTSSDGILFFGGADFPPSVYGQKTNLLTSIKTPYRHYFELSFLFHLLGGYQDTSFVPLLEQKPEYVIRGFCLGMQSMNVATGGTMYQDIPSDVYGLDYVEAVLEMDPDQVHRNYWRNLAPREDLIWCSFHRIQFKPGSLFFTEMDLDTDFNPYVCSSHHQAVKDVGYGFDVIATSMDGNIIEAMSHTEYKNVLGVQFHPEAYAIYFPEAGKHKRASTDTVLVSEYDVIQQKNSLDFHKRFWAHFSESF
jgi:putative glutamine amidotransferase